jgi:CHAD domain-containing protein
VHWKNSETIGKNLARVVPALISDYFQAGDQAMSKGVSWKKLHHFRLETKHLRYTLELFESEYGPLFQTKLSELRKVQTMLGDINDCMMTRKLLGKAADMKLARDLLGKKADNKLKKLRNYWKTKFATAERRDHWIDYFKRSPLRRRSRVA